MRPLALALTFLVSAALAWAASALATTPSPGNHTIPGHIVLVGLGAAGPDSATGHCTVTVRDLANNPVPNSVVIFDFSSCTDMAPAVDQRDPRLVVTCALRQVSSVTDANGIARFTVLGTATAGPPSPLWGLKIYADGVLLGSPRLSALERDGAGGLTLNDLSPWTADFFSAADPMRADLNGDGYVSVLDLSVWAGAYFAGSNSVAIGTVCP